MKNRTEYYITRALIGLCEGCGDVVHVDRFKWLMRISSCVLQWIYSRCRPLHFVLLQDWRAGHPTVFVLVGHDTVPLSSRALTFTTIRSSLNLARILSNLLAAAILPMRGVAGKTGWFWLFIIEVRSAILEKPKPVILITTMFSGPPDLCRRHLLLLLASRQPGRDQDPNRPKRLVLGARGDHLGKRKFGTTCSCVRASLRLTINSESCEMIRPRVYRLSRTPSGGRISRKRGQTPRFGVWS